MVVTGKKLEITSMKRNFEKLKAALIIFLLLSAFALSSCSLLSSDNDSPRKNANVKYDFPPSPFVQLDTTDADAAWQSKTTGNTIALNSTCSKDTDRDLKDLEKSILNGVDNRSIESEKSVKLDGVDARRVLVSGSTEGISIRTDIVTLKKGDCTYDLSYIGRKKNFEEDHGAFEKFIKKFHAP
jgi:hypothetical protein